MPVKISNTEQTSPLSGVMNISDVHRVLNDYRKKIELECTDPSRNPVQKRYYFDIDLRRIKQVVKQKHDSDNDESSTEPKKVRINITMNLSGQLNCEQTESIENNLSILVCGVDGRGQSLLNDGNFILVEGFNDHDDLGLSRKEGGGPCCVQGMPYIN